MKTGASGNKRKIETFIKNVMDEPQANQRVENFLLRDIQDFNILSQRVENYFLLFGATPQAFVDYFVFGIPNALPEKCLMQSEMGESAFKAIFEIPLFLWLMKDEIQAFYDAPKEALAKIKRRTSTQLEGAGIDTKSNHWLNLIELDAKENITAMEIIQSLGLVSTLKALRLKRVKRTRQKAELNSGAIVKGSPILALPSDKKYGNALGFNPQGNAYIVIIKEREGIVIEKGKALDTRESRRIIGQGEFKSLTTMEGLENKDIGLLELVYTLVYNRFTKSGYKDINPIITVKAEVLLDNPCPNNKDIAGLIKRLEAFNDMVSIIRNGNKIGYNKVLTPLGYDASDNTFKIAIPFFSELLKEPYQEVIELEKQGGKLQANETPRTLPKHSRLIKSSLRKRKDKAAAENVVIIVRLIEQAGKGIPHIKATTLIDKNPLLIKKLEETGNQTQVLKRAFTNTWKYLREDTIVQDYYPNIRLPDPDNPANIPTQKTLENMIFKFPHEGKKGREQK